ncbi:MAG: 2-isopropylmalate synthase, partial [uncultured Frankineae bacterium]
DRPHELVRPDRPHAQCRPLPPVPAGRPPRPHVARPCRRPRPAVVQRRPARRQPGPHRPDGRRPQDADVPAARRHGLQGDRGRLPGREHDRLRLHPGSRRAGPRPRRRHDPGPHPGARGAHRAHRAVARGPARHRAGAPLQLDLDAAAARGVRTRRGRHSVHRRARRRVVRQVRRAAAGRRDHRALAVQPRVVHRHRAGLRAGGVPGRHGRVAADAGQPGGAQPAGHGGDVGAEHVRRPDRVVRPRAGGPALERRALAAPAQRPGDRCRGRRAGRHGRRRPRRGVPVRQRRAHRQRLPGDARAQPAQPGRRPADRLQRRRRGAPHRRALQPAAGPPPPPVRRRPGLHGVLRLAPGRHQEGLRGPRAGGRGRRDARARDGVGRAVPADRPARRRPVVRSRDPRQQPVRQGRRRLRAQERAPPRPPPPHADRVLAGRAGGRRRRGRRDRLRPHLGAVRADLPAARGAAPPRLVHVRDRGDRPDRSGRAVARGDAHGGRRGQRADRRLRPRAAGPRPRRAGPRLRRARHRCGGGGAGRVLPRGGRRRPRPVGLRCPPEHRHLVPQGHRERRQPRLM